MRESQELFVYECRGEGAPTGEPAGPGFIGMWPELPYTYLFFELPAEERVQHWLAGQFGWQLTGSYRLDYDQWQQTAPGIQRIGPFEVDARPGKLSRSSRERSGLRICLDPGVVFGSGVHPTTRGCLLTLARLFESQKIQTAVDFGTGTGILAIAVSLCGARRVTALDCNPLAIRVARQNFERNGVDVACCVGEELGVLGRPADLLLMNIEWPCLQKVLGEASWQAYPCVILSGFLIALQERLLAQIPATHRLIDSASIDGWGTLVLATGVPQAAHLKLKM